MSRLDSAIRRLNAQKLTLEAATAVVAGLDGPFLEIGLGNGRTYDHLREIAPGREIWVFDRQVAAHPDCIPPEDRMILGDVRQTLADMAARIGGEAAMAHLDIGTGEKASSMALAEALAPAIAALMRPGGVLVSDQPVTGHGFSKEVLPEGVAEGRIHLYRYL